MEFKKIYNLDKYYEEVAKEHGVTVEEVKRDMTEAMKQSNTDIDNLEEFIVTLSEMVKQQINAQKAKNCDTYNVM